MKVPRILFELTKQLEAASIDYRIGGSQAAVYYGLREQAGDWDIAISEVTPELQQILSKLGFTEIADSEGLSWEGPVLIDFIIADGKRYPTLEELGVRYAEGLKFVARSMMGYINWKEGESAYQHLKEYRNKIEEMELPEVVEERFDLEKFEKMAQIEDKLKTIGKSRAITRAYPMENASVLKIAKSLVKIADALDEAGLVLPAAQADRLAQEIMPMQNVPSPAPLLDSQSVHQKAAEEWRKKRIVDQVLTKAAGVDPATLSYYRSIEPVIRQFSKLLDAADTLEKGSQKHIQIIRYVSDKFNQIYDPYNVAHAPAKIRFIDELLKLEDAVKNDLAKMVVPEHGFDTIVENYVTNLKESGALQEINKLKKFVE